MIALFYFSLQLLYALTLNAITFVKLVCFGLASIVIHYTNWSIIWQAVFLLLTLPAVVSRRSATCVNVRCAGHVVAACYLPLLQSVVFVLVAVYSMLLVDADFIARFFDKHDPGVVIFSNSLLHFVPVLSYALFTLVQPRLIMYGLKLWFVPAAAPQRRCRLGTLVALIVYQMFGATLIVFALYLATLRALDLSLQWVYVDLPTALAIGGLIAVGIVVVGPILAVLTYSYGLVDAFDADELERAIRYTDKELRAQK